MKAIEITQYGSPGVLKLGERPVPETKAGKVLIRVYVAGVNRPDVFQRTGNYPMSSGVSDIPGLEVAGEIVNGDLAHVNNRYGLKVGDYVYALVQGGGCVEFRMVPLGQVLPVPAGLFDVEATALSEGYFTVQSSVFDCGLLGRDTHGADETLLVQGGSSGIRATAIQIASVLDHRVFATAGGTGKCDACVRLGAIRAINYKTEDLVGIAKARTGLGADVVPGIVGGSYVAREIACTADDSYVVLVTLLGGAKAEVSLGDILRRHFTLMGSILRPRPVVFEATIAANLCEAVWSLLVSGRVKPVVHEVMPATQVAQARTLMELSAYVGKIMLAWD